jgi:toxin ParE1/3/4
VANIVILPAARADLMDIGDFIALDNRTRAASFVAEIEAKILEVGDRPGSFQKRDELHKGLRHARHGRYLIFFIERDDEVQIVRVIEGSRNLPRLLEL